MSSATVSRILNQDETLSVTTKTRERVLEIAQELNYKKKDCTFFKNSNRHLPMGYFISRTRRSLLSGNTKWH
ncbi:MAG: LacI family DNA-binding transcriptional regulator [Anaerobutyricum sp.]